MNVLRKMKWLAALALLAMASSAHAVGVPVSLVADQPAYLVGATVTVKVQMGASATPVWGGQFFLTYNNANLAFQSATTGDAPFTQQIYSFAAAPNIDYAVGGTAGATTTTTMAVLKFTALAPIGSTADLVSFRAHTPPTRLTDNNATEVASTTSNLPAVSIASWTGTDAYVDDNYIGLPNGTVVNWPSDGLPGPHAIGVDAFATIQGGVNNVSNSGTVHVASGTYGDTLVSGRTGLNIQGAGSATTTIVGSHNSGSANTLLVLSSPGTTLSGFTITRSGNNPTDWGSNVKAYGLNVSSSNGSLVRDCVISGNRNGLYMENNDSVTIRNSVIDNNRTGMHLVAINTNCTIAENFITNNWTDGVLFRTESASNNTTGTRFVGNNITGNWYGQIEYREDFTAMPKDFSGNWFGSTAPTSSAVSFGEPGYAAQIPTAFGGTAVPPPAGPTFNVYDIKGNASAQFDISPMLTSGGDTGPSVYADSNGFQGDFSDLLVTPQFNQVGSTGRVQEGVNLIADGAATGGFRTVHVPAATYKENLTLNKAVKVSGPNAGTAGNGARAPEATIVSNGNANAVAMVTASNVTLDGLTIDGDDPASAGFGLTYAGTDANTVFGISNFVQGPSTIFQISNLTVQNNIIKNTYQGVRLSGNGTVSMGNTITRNWFDAIGVFDFGYAVSLRSHVYADFTSNLVTRTWTGFHSSIHSLAGPAVWSISNNEMHTYGCGIASWGVDTGAATGPTISNNQLSAETVPAPLAGNAGIIIFYHQGPLTSIAGNTIGGHDYGIIATGAFSSGANTLSIGANTISSSKTGVLFTNNLTSNPVGTSNLNAAAYSFPTAVNINGLTINGAANNGIVVNTTGPSTALASITATHADGAGIAVDSGVKVTGALASASIVANPTTFTGFANGVLVDGGKALIQTTNLTGNSAAAIKVQNNGKVDAGDCSASNFTGLGSSTGGNVLTGYGFDNASPFAVNNANTSGQFNVYAQNNSYGAGFADNIADLIYDSADNAANSTVLYSQSGGQGITAAVASNDYCNYSVPASVTFTATYSGPGTVEWRDGTCTGTLLGSGNPFVWTNPPSAPGTHTYYARLVNDGCVAECASTTITVHAAPVITANIELSGVVAGPFTRCITFDFFTSPTCPLPTFSHEETVTFSGGAGSVVFVAPCGSYTCVTARDRLHTLRRTSDGAHFLPSGNDYTVNFTDTKSLLGGNVNDDNFIDILDFGGYIGKFGLADPATNCSTTGLHPDFSGSGDVGIDDFTFISSQFLFAREPDCCSNPLSEGTPTLEIPVIELARRDYEMARTADLNRDGILNTADIAFLGQHGFARCSADFYADGSVNVQDIFIFLDNWFGGFPAADFNDDHTNGVNDVFEFLNVWFQGC